MGAEFGKLQRRDVYELPIGNNFSGYADCTNVNKKVQDEYLNFLHGLFKDMEPTKYIQLAYLAGILPFRKDKSQSAVNNLRPYSMSD